MLTEEAANNGGASTQERRLCKLSLQALFPQTGVVTSD